MSHFTVLVINTEGFDNVDDQMAPFQENNMGDCPEKYLAFHELDLKDEGYESVEEMEVDGYQVKDGKPGYWENPNAKWDWYVTGGRWAGYLKIKPEFKDEMDELNFSWGWKEEDKLKKTSQAVADQALKRQIDWDAYHNGDDFDSAMRFWELVVEGEEPQSKEEEDTIKWNFYKPEYFIEKYKNKETYARITCSFSTYAVLKDGEWHEPGEMGMFGMSCASPEEEGEFGLTFFDKFIKDLPEDALLTVVDCHI